MRWLLGLLWTIWMTLVLGIDDFNVDEYKALLLDATMDVYRQHMDEMSHVPQPPEFQMPSNFMRSYLPNTGVGNREELVIRNVHQIPVFNDEEFLQFRYRRFNNTDYVLAANTRRGVLYQMEPSRNDYLVFSKEDAVISFIPDNWSLVKDVALFTRLLERTSILYAAILTESTQNSRVIIYEIIGNKGIPGTFIDLGISPSDSLFTVNKISHVQSQYGESLVVLIDSPDVTKLSYQQKGSSELNHYIEVYYPNAVDLVTFMVHGHGYIAVGNATIISIFKLDEFARKHLLFDWLAVPSGDLVNLEYFRLGFHHYLAVTGRDEQLLYIWKSGEFALKQVLKGYRVNQLYSSTLSTCRDDVILVMIKDDMVDIYVYDGRTDSFVPSPAEIPKLLILSGSITSFKYKNNAVLLFADHGRNVLAFVVEASLHPLLNPFLVAGEEISKQMKSIQEMVKEQTRQLVYIKNVLDNAVRTTGDQYITAFQSFQNLLSQGDTIVNEIDEPLLIKWEESSLTLDEYKKGTKMLEQSIVTLEKLVQEMEQTIPDIVRVDRDTIITGKKTFTGDVSGSSILALAVKLHSAAGINVQQLQKEIYRLDKPQQIKGTLTFEKPLTIKGDLDIEKTLNGIDIDKDVMTTNTRQISYGEMTFKNKLIVNGDLQISGKLNDIDIRNEVVTLSGSHHITGKKSFLNGILAETVETRLLDGMDISDMYHRALTKSGKQEVPGTKIFNAGLVSKNIVLDGLLNGYNITELAEDIVRIDKPSDVKGHKTFTDDVVMSDALIVGGTVNGLHIPEDLFLVDIAQNVTGNKVFTGTVTAENVMVSGTIDDLNLPDDIVTLSKDDTLKGTVYFAEGINVESDIIVEGLVDGIDVSEVAKEALKLNESSEFKNAVFRGNVTILDNLEVGGTVNDVNLDQLVKDIIFKDEENVIVESEKHFKKVVADTVALERKINGYDITADFMKVNGKQIINGTKTFKKMVHFNSINIGDGKIGGLNINQLHEKRLSLLIKDDEINKDFEFSDEVVVKGDLIVHGHIGGLQIPDDIVLRNSTKSIANKIFTNRVKVDNLIVDGDAHVSQSFDGINLTEFYNDRITLHTEQEIEGDVQIANSTIETLELTGFVNGIDIAEFANNVMSKTQDQTVWGEKEFLGITTVYGPITTEKGINGVDLAELNNRAFKLTTDNYVEEPFEFEDITVNNITVAGLVNGVNLTFLAENSLKKRGPQSVSGITTFDAGFHVEGDIVAERINDMFIPEDVLLKNLPQTINGKFTLGSVGISDNLEVAGLVNGLDLSEIAPHLVTKDHEMEIESNVTFVGPIHISNNIEVTGLVNGINLKSLPENVLLKKGDQEISGHKILRGNVTISGDANLTFVNGINWQEFLKDVVRIDISQRIDAPKRFLEDTEVTNLTASMAQVEMVNGRKLENFLNDVVFTDVPANITGTKVFKNPVRIANDLNAELINDLKLKTDVVTLVCLEDDPQVITGQKTFQNVIALGDVVVNGKVNSYDDLYALYLDTLLTEGNQNVTGVKTLSGKTVFKGDVSSDTVNGMVLHEDLITLHTNQDIYGPLVFSDVFIQGNLNVDGLINGINITELAQDAVYLDTNDTIEGEYNLENVIAVHDVEVEGTVNYMDLAAFDRNVTNYWNDAFRGLSVMEKFSQANCEVAKFLQNVLSKSYYVLDAFIFYQELEYAASHIHVRSPLGITLVHYKDSWNTAAAVQSTWNSTTKQFLTYGDTVETNIKKVIFQKVAETDIELNIGITDKDSNVLINGYMMNIPGGFQDADILIQGEKEAIIALLFPVKSVCEMYILTQLHTNRPEVYNYGVASIGKDSTAVAIFSIRNSTYLAVSRLYNRGMCKIYGRIGNDWRTIQNIPVTASTAVKHFMYRNFHYLAFTNVASVPETREPKSIQIFRNPGLKGRLFSLIQKIPFDDAKGFEVFKFGDLSELYLTTWNDTRIQVLRLEGESGLQSRYIIHGKCIQDVKPLLIKNDVYLVVGQQNHLNDIQVSSVLYKGLTKGSKYTPHAFEHC